METQMEFVLWQGEPGDEMVAMHRFRDGEAAARTLINWQRERPGLHVYLSVEHVQPRTERLWICPQCESDDLRVLCLMEVEDDVDQDSEAWPAPEGAFRSEERDVTARYARYRYRCQVCDAEDITPLRIERPVPVPEGW